jgi:predicted aminopeptidase
MFTKKRIILTLLIVLLGIVVWQWQWSVYLYQQAKGGLNVAFNTRPLKEVLEDPNVADSLKEKIRLIAEIKRFASDSLGLKDNPDVYQTLFDQKGKPLVYLVTVAEPYQVKGVDFDFPIIGKFSYKGFFDSTMAVAEENKWKKAGYDTDLGQGAAYSTLGWLPEPILSSMLFYPEGKLASLIIHEMVHGTIFIKNDHETSENLANFIGDYGAKRYLLAKYGKESPIYKKYTQSKVWKKILVAHLNKSTLALDSLYQTFQPEYPKKYKDSLKYAFIKHIVQDQERIYQQVVLRKKKYDTKTDIPLAELPNNAYFIGFKTYNAQQNQFETLFEEKHKSNFSTFMKDLSKTYQ